MSRDYIVVLGYYRSGTRFLFNSLLKNTNDCIIYENDKHNWSHQFQHLFRGTITVAKSGQSVDSHGTPVPKMFEMKTREGVFTKYVLIYKDPYSWLVSFRDRYDSILLGKRTTKNLIDQWYKKHLDYLSFLEGKKYCLVNYHDLIRFYQFQINKICVTIEIQRVEEITNPFSDVHVNPRGNKNFDINYYTKKQYLEYLSNDDIDYINSTIPNSFFNKLKVAKCYWYL